MLRRILTGPVRSPYDAPLRYLWPSLLLSGTIALVLVR